MTYHVDAMEKKMAQRKCISTRNQVLILYALLNISLSVMPAYAWQPVVTIGAGGAIFSDVGSSQTVPIQNPDTDQFYDYSAHSETQTSGLLDIFLGAQWNVQPQWALQTGIDYAQTVSIAASGTLVQGADAQSADTYGYSYNILTRQLLLEGKLLYTLDARYHPYILAGMGAAFNDASGYDTTIPPFLTFTREYADHTTTSFSYALGMGMDVDLAPQLRIGVGYRFADLGQVGLGSANIDSVPVSGTLSQLHLYVNEVLLQITGFF